MERTQQLHEIVPVCARCLGLPVSVTHLGGQGEAGPLGVVGVVPGAGVVVGVELRLEHPGLSQLCRRAALVVVLIELPLQLACIGQLLAGGRSGVCVEEGFEEASLRKLLSRASLVVVLIELRLKATGMGQLTGRRRTGVRIKLSLEATGLSKLCP